MSENLGHFEEKYPREAFLGAIDELDGMATTSEIAAAVGCVRETAYKRLKAMEEDELVVSRNGGKGSPLLWRRSE